MSRDVLTVGSTMRIPLLYQGEYSQWVERFMNYLEEQTDGEAMINSIKNGDQPLLRVTQVSIAGTTSTEQPLLKDKSIWSDQEKIIQDAQKKVMIAFENADSSSRVELIPSKIKYANKAVLNFHKEFSVFSSFTRKGNDGLLQDQVFKNKEEVVINVT
uniref:DUF4219 domain-containing protein/UBN2 domain-containing protein n=1 Tax=Tanacetum cinerariifolium TaxID=118510 RepID=A0A6L2MHQ5_TANCI|nr:hypothetical protein [Tanacetum cinerariifolium]